MNDDPRDKGFRSIHRTLADPVRLRILDALWIKPRSAKELSGLAGLPPDRLYYHLRKLEQARLIRVAEYRELRGGKVERVYTVAETEPPGDDASLEEEERFLMQLLEATAADLGSAYRGRADGAERRATLFRGGARLSRKHLDELRAHVERLAREAFENPDEDGVWTRIVFALVDLQDRKARRPVPEEPNMIENAKRQARKVRTPTKRGEGATS